MGSSVIIQNTQVKVSSILYTIDFWPFLLISGSPTYLITESTLNSISSGTFSFTKFFFQNLGCCLQARTDQPHMLCYVAECTDDSRYYQKHFQAEIEARVRNFIHENGRLCIINAAKNKKKSVPRRRSCAGCHTMRLIHFPIQFGQLQSNGEGGFFPSVFFTTILVVPLLLSQAASRVAATSGSRRLSSGLQTSPAFSL
jgi:hypothetical protein